MLDRHQLEAFAAVVEHQSFKRAASILNVTRGAISQRIKLLEKSLSTVLLIRDQPVVPTVAGEVLLRHVKALRLLEDDVYRQVTPMTGTSIRPTVAIAVNAESLATWFGASSQALLRRLPVALEILVEDEDQTSAMLARGNVVGCISAESKPSQGFEALWLGAMDYCCVATPGFADEHFPHGLQLRYVLNAPAILFNRKHSRHDAFLENFFGTKVEKYARHYFPSPIALLDAILASNGYGIVPTDQARPLLARGQLVDLAPSHPIQAALYWHHWQAEPGVARTITEFVVQAANEALLSRPGLVALHHDASYRPAIHA